jgi:glutamate-1-semialdehyde 2,1-aminomutase
LWAYGKELIQMIERKALDHGISQSFKVAGIDCSPYCMTLDDAGFNSLDLRTVFLQEMIRNGVLFQCIALCYRHNEEELKITEIAIDKSFAIYRRALDEGVEKYLEGPAVKPVFRKYN